MATGADTAAPKEADLAERVRERNRNSRIGDAGRMPSEQEMRDGWLRACRIAAALGELGGRPAVTTESRSGGIRVTLRVRDAEGAAGEPEVLRVLGWGDRFGHVNSGRWERVWAEVDEPFPQGWHEHLLPVEYYPEGRPGLPWHAVGEDPDGLLLAETADGVALALATDQSQVLMIPPDEWADLCDAAKAGRFDELLGGRALCADPRG
ncbi:hypothetical protein [Kitasatospora sp. NPDC004531]